MAKHQQRSRDTFARDGGYRGQRLEGLFREELNSLLDGEVSDPRLYGVRVTRVELTRDGSSARVWFVTRTDDTASIDDVHAAFDRAAGFLRSRACESLPVKRSPELRFRHDPAAVLEPHSFDETR